MKQELPIEELMKIFNAESIHPFYKLIDWPMTLEEYTNLLYREELPFDPIEGHIYKARGEKNAICLRKGNSWEFYKVSLKTNVDLSR